MGLCHRALVPHPGCAFPGMVRWLLAPAGAFIGQRSTRLMEHALLMRMILINKKAGRPGVQAVVPGGNVARICAGLVDCRPEPARAERKGSGSVGQPREPPGPRGQALQGCFGVVYGTSS